MKRGIWYPERQSFSSKIIRGLLNEEGYRDCPASGNTTGGRGPHTRTWGPLRGHTTGLPAKGAWVHRNVSRLVTKCCLPFSTPPSGQAGGFIVQGPMVWGRGWERGVTACPVGGSRHCLTRPPLFSVSISAYVPSPPFQCGVVGRTGLPRHTTPRSFLHQLNNLFHFSDSQDNKKDLLKSWSLDEKKLSKCPVQRLAHRMCPLHFLVLLSLSPTSLFSSSPPALFLVLYVFFFPPFP